MPAQPRKMSEVLKGMSENAIRFLEETRGLSRNDAAMKVAAVAAELGIG